MIVGNGYLATCENWYNWEETEAVFIESWLATRTEIGNTLYSHLEVDLYFNKNASESKA